MNTNEPLITIGIPVFNGSKTLNKLFKSIIDQSYINIEVIISNNCSSDDTEIKCKNFIKEFKNVKYFSQSKILTMHENFRFVLNSACENSKYFTWMAADDYRSHDFLTQNVNFLEKNIDYVASISPVKFDSIKTSSYNIGDLGLEDKKISNRLNISLNKLHANSRLFSVFRKSAFNDFKYIDNEFLGYDYLFIIHILRKGKFKRINKGFVILSKQGSSNQKNIFKINRETAIELILPFKKLLSNSLYLYKKENLYLKYILILRINLFNFSSLILRLKWLIIKFINNNESN